MLKPIHELEISNSFNFGKLALESNQPKESRAKILRDRDYPNDSKHLDPAMPEAGIFNNVKYNKVLFLHKSV